MVHRLTGKVSSAPPRDIPGRDSTGRTNASGDSSGRGGALQRLAEAGHAELYIASGSVRRGSNTAMGLKASHFVSIAFSLLFDTGRFLWT